MPRDPLVEQIVGETQTAIRLWSPQFGDLITVSLPAACDTEEKILAAASTIQNWYRCEAPYFRGAKLVVLKPGVILGINDDDALLKIGYVRAPDRKAALEGAPAHV